MNRAKRLSGCRKANGGALSRYSRAALLSCTCFGSSFLPIAVSSANPLDDLAASQQVQRLHPKNLRGEVAPPEEIAPNGEYWRLFLESTDGPVNLLEWIGTPPEDYKLDNRSVVHEADFVGATVIYKDKVNRKFKVEVLVPHPKRFDAARYGLIPEFHAIDETVYGADAVDAVHIRDLKGTILTRVSGSCLLKVPLERQAWFTISRSEECDDPMSLVELARTLDLERLNLKLSF